MRPMQRSAEGDPQEEPGPAVHAASVGRARRSRPQPWMAYAAARNEAYVNELLHKGTPAPATVKLAAVFQAYAQDDVQAFNQAVGDFERLLADRAAGRIGLAARPI